MTYAFVGYVCFGRRWAGSCDTFVFFVSNNIVFLFVPFIVKSTDFPGIICVVDGSPWDTFHDIQSISIL